MSSPNSSSDSDPDWRNLPIGPLGAISKRLTSIHDYLYFRGVCSSWRSAAIFANFDGAIPRVPWLMFVSGDEEEKKKEENGGDVKRVVNFFDVVKNKSFKITDFAPSDAKMYLSCGGWILCVSVSEGNCEVKLTNVVWRVIIELPCLDTFPDYTREDGVGFIRKMVLSGSPTRKTDFLVMVIWGKNKQLGFCRPGDSSWNVMAKWDVPFSDILYHGRKLCAVDFSRRVVECDVHGPNPGQLLQVFSLPNDVGNRFPTPNKMYYLVESSGTFMIVCRYIKEHKKQTFWFDVIEIDLNDGSHTEIRNLRNKSLFLGFNSSLCLQLSDWNAVRLRPNRVYFTDDLSERCVDSDIGSYCFSSMTIQGIPGGFVGSFPAPHVWVVPSF